MYQKLNFQLNNNKTIKYQKVKRLIMHLYL
jgi:hypothetical protein